jgi:6-phosphogluconolactonase
MANSRLVFVGTYTEPIRFGSGRILEGKGKGIYSYRLDVTSGAMAQCGLAAGVKNPSYLAFAPSHQFLYAVNELKEFEGAASGAISAFLMDAESGQLRFLNSKPTHGTDPCHLTVHPSGKYVLVANFMSGSVCVLPIGEDGALGDATDFIQHAGSSVNPNRQSGPHAHAVMLDQSGRFVIVPDLGLDKLMIYRFDAQRGKLAAHDEPWVETAAGAGPRQCVMHPRGGYVYVINELDSTMTAYRFDEARGIVREIQTLSTLPEGFTGTNSCAEVQVDPAGKFLYGSNRGHDSIVIYAIDQRDGTLTYVGHEATQGRIPRNFVVDPSGEFLLAANQDSDNIVIFRLDRASGKLMETGQRVDVPTPVCIKVL